MMKYHVSEPMENGRKRAQLYLQPISYIPIAYRIKINYIQLKMLKTLKHRKKKREKENYKLNPKTSSFINIKNIKFIN